MPRSTHTQCLQATLEGARLREAVLGPRATQHLRPSGTHRSGAAQRLAQSNRTCPSHAMQQKLLPETGPGRSRRRPQGCSQVGT